MKGQSPLLGFNNNVKHRGRVFHIQTEDSGVKHPHVITHLFADGGRILKTKKTSYAEYVEDEQMKKLVRQMMQEQHKAMFIALRAGRFDHLVEGLDPIPEKKAEPAESSEKKPASDETAATADGSKAAPTASKDGPTPAEPATTRKRAVPPARPARDAAVAATEPAMTAQSQPEPRNPTRPMDRAKPGQVPEPTPPAGSGIELDLDALERAAKEAQTPMVSNQMQNLPPPPANMLGRRRIPTMGGYRSVTPSSEDTAPPSERRRPAATGSRPTSQDRNHSKTPGRYAPSRPAPVFNSERRPEEGASIFGEELISEKSLDEVILSYLSEDLDGQPPKK